MTQRPGSATSAMPVRRIEPDHDGSDDRLRLALAAAGLGIWEFNPGRGVFGWSDRCYELFGLPPGADVDAQRILDLIQTDDRDMVRAAIANVLDPAGDGTYSIEYRIRRPSDGAQRWIAATGRLFRDDHGTASRLVGTMVDITQRKQEELAERARARQALLGAAVGVALTSTDPMPVRLRRCVQTMIEHLDAAVARIWTLNAGDRVLELVASSSLSTDTDAANDDPHARVPVGRGKVGRVARDRRPILFNDLMSDVSSDANADDPDRSDADWARRLGLTAYVGCPLIVGGHLVGVLGLFARAPFSQDTLGALRSVSDSLAVAIIQWWIEQERDQLVQRERSAREEAEMLLRTVASLSTELDLHKLVQTVTESATSVTGAQFGAFFYNVVDAQGERYTLYTVAGVPREAFSQFPMPRNTAIFAPTFAGQGIVRLDDVTQDPRFGQNPPYHGMPPGHLPVRSYLAVPVTSRQGDVIGGLFFGHARAGVFTDRSERLVAGIAAHTAVAIDNARLFAAEKAARDDFSRQAEQLAAANRELEAFSYSVSHDLRTPLRAMDGFSRILLEEYAASMDPEAQRYLQIVRNGACQMGALVDDLLTFSRLGRQALEVRSVNVERLASEAWADLRHEWEQREIEFEIADNLPSATGDPTMLRLALANLLSNAIKFSRTRTPAVIAVGWRLEGDDVAYFVQDNGVGFDMRYADKLFGVFQRLHRAEEYEGTGVGLANVQRIVSRHGGRIWAEADLDRGATFLFTLAPAASATSGEERGAR